MKYVLCSLLVLFVVACKKDNNNGPVTTKDSVTIISQAAYYYTPDTTVKPNMLAFQYDNEHRITRISQIYLSATDSASWTFAYNTNGTLATVKGKGQYWDTKQDYYFYYNASSRLDSILIIDTAYGGYALRSANVYNYDANNHIKSAYSYVCPGSTVPWYHLGDTLLKAAFARNADLDSINFVTYTPSPFPNDPPTIGAATAQFEKAPVTDISPLDKAFLFWLSIRANPLAPSNYNSSFWYQYIMPDIPMVRGGTIKEKGRDLYSYTFTATKNADGSIASAYFAGPNITSVRGIKISYKKVAK